MSFLGYHLSGQGWITNPVGEHSSERSSWMQLWRTGLSGRAAAWHLLTEPGSGSGAGNAEAMRGSRTKLFQFSRVRWRSQHPGRQLLAAVGLCGWVYVVRHRQCAQVCEDVNQAGTLLTPHSIKRLPVLTVPNSWAVELKWQFILNLLSVSGGKY